MAYIIRTTDGTTLGTILDGTIDDRVATSLQLVGKNYSNYGQIMTDNLVSLLESWSNNVAPPNPLAGQLWWNKSDKRLRVYTGAEFKTLGGATSQASTPNTTTSGDLWWNSSDKQLYCYDGTTPYSVTGWILVGPEKDNTGAKWDQITDTLSTIHTVISMFISGTRVAIISTDPEWTPLPAISGFTTIKPGYNAVNNGTFNGVANNSSRLGGIDASNYLRSDVADSTTGGLTIENNAGLTIGLQSNLAITAQTTGNIVYRNAIEDSNTLFKIATPLGDANVMTLSGAQNRVTVNKLTVSSSDNSSSPSTGALVVTGGLGVGGRLAVAGTSAFNSPVFVPTAPVGTANLWVATTEFVVNNSGFLTNKIYAGANAQSSTTYIDVNSTGSPNARVVVDNVTVATASASGFNLLNGATAVTQPDTYNGVGNARIATTQFVKNATQWWGGSKKFVSNVAPNPGVNDVGSVDGDFWFQYTL